MRKFAIVFLWYFLVLSPHGIATVGPFPNKGACTKIHEWAATKLGSWNIIYYSDCWDGDVDISPSPSIPPGTTPVPGYGYEYSIPPKS